MTTFRFVSGKLSQLNLIHGVGGMRRRLKISDGREHSFALYSSIISLSWHFWKKYTTESLLNWFLPKFNRHQFMWGWNIKLYEILGLSLWVTVATQFSSLKSKQRDKHLQRIVLGTSSRGIKVKNRKSRIFTKLILFIIYTEKN